MSGVYVTFDDCGHKNKLKFSQINTQIANHNTSVYLCNKWLRIDRCCQKENFSQKTVFSSEPITVIIQ